MSDLAQDGLPPLRDVIAQHGLSARKSLGQNFLLDLNLTRRIARASGNLDGAKVIEVGPGPGGLTRALLMEGAAQVTAIERDSRCLKALDEIARHYPGRLTVIEGDAMDIDVSSHLSGPTRIVANLPYNIGTALLTGWLSDPSWPPWWESLTLLFQKEVAERITAAPGSKSYGRLSVLGQWRSMARGVFEIPPQAFTPAPKVTSALVHITPKNAPTGVSPAALERLTASAFGQRRKMLRQSLKGLHTDPIAVLESCGIAPTERAENVPIEGYLALARALSPQPSA